MDLIQAAFLFCFVFGLALTLLSFGFGFVHLGAHGHGAGLDGDHGPAHPHLSILNVNTLTVFLAFFGGVGYLLYSSSGLGVTVAVVAAILAGALSSAAVFLFVTRVLLRAQRFMDPEDYRVEGALARVSKEIRAGGIGEILYVKDSVRHSDGARGATGGALAAGTEVVVVRYEHGIAYVEPWTSFTAEVGRQIVPPTRQTAPGSASTPVE